jgi:ribosome maturation factor RimP
LYGAEKHILPIVESFERAATALPFEPEFRDVEIVAHRAQRNGASTDLTLVVDRPDGVDLALCERVAARLNAVLDFETEAYTLAVESAGLDRPLVRPSDYERFRGRVVRVQTTLPIANAKTHRGTLVGVRVNAVVLATDSGELPIPIELIKAANLEFDYRSALKREKTERRKKR